MQALHRKLVLFLVQILSYNCSDIDYSFCEDSPPAGLRHLPRCEFDPQTPLAPTITFAAPPLVYEMATQASLTFFVAVIIAEDPNYHRPTRQEQFLEQIDDDEAVAIVRRCLIPTDRLQLRAEIGKGSLIFPLLLLFSPLRTHGCIDAGYCYSRCLDVT